MEPLKVSRHPRLLEDIPEVEALGSSQDQDQENQSPRRPPPVALNNPTSRSYLHIQKLLPSYYQQTMDNSASSAPASLRAERSGSGTPNSDQSRDASPKRPSSATDMRLIVPSVVPRSLSSSSDDSRSVSTLPADVRGREPYGTDLHPPVQTGTMNLKLLTCHWWLQTRNCRFSDKDCLYAHYDTGKHAEAPRQIIPGQAAVAGRNADRRIRQVESSFTNLSLEHARNMNPNLEMRAHSSSSSLADISNVFNASLPDTPGLMLSSPSVTNPHNMGQPFHLSVIIPNSPLYHATTDNVRLEGEVRFFRTLVEQGGKEKDVMIRTIESLQAENQALRATNASVTNDIARLTGERDVLRRTVSILQPRGAAWGDYGAIGGKRNGT